MTFTRSNTGLSNFATFFDAEYLLYSEGGSAPKDNNGEYKDTWSIDSIFWKSIFRKFRPDIRIKIKSLGSKDCVRPYAEKIANNEIKNSLAAFDRDYDPYKGETFDHPNIFYTCGYSWENDVCRPEFVIAILETLHPNGEINSNLKTDIHSQFEKFLRQLNRLTYIDLLCGIVNIKGVDRERFWNLIDTTEPQNFKLKKDKFKELIKEIKTRRTTPLRYIGNKRISPESDCYGKIIAMFCYFVLCENYKAISECKNVPRHFADKMIAEAIGNPEIQVPKEITNHYGPMLSRMRA